MRRLATLAGLITAIVLLVVTIPDAPIAHGPIRHISSTSSAEGNLYRAELTGDPVLATEAVTVNGEQITFPEGHDVVIVSVRITSLAGPLSGLRAGLVIDGVPFASDERLDAVPSVSYTTLAPGLWTGGDIAFRVPEGTVLEADEVRIELSPLGVLQQELAELLSIPLGARFVTTAHAEVRSAEVVGAWSG